MQEILFFLKKCIDKSTNYQLAWSYIFGNISLTNDSQISIFEIIAKNKIPKPTLYSILNFGFDYFDNSGTSNFKFYLKNNSVFCIIKKNDDILNFPKKRIIQNKPLRRKKIDPSLKIENAIIIEDFSKYDQIIENIISFLNSETNQNFSPKDVLTKKIIIERIEEGITENDFLNVIVTKTNQWKHTVSKKYLRPKTLFGSNMDQYINETITIVKTPPKTLTQQTHESVESAKELLAHRRKQYNSRES